MLRGIDLYILGPDVLNGDYYAAMSGYLVLQGHIGGASGTSHRIGLMRVKKRKLPLGDRDRTASPVMLSNPTVVSRSWTVFKKHRMQHTLTAFSNKQDCGSGGFEGCDNCLVFMQSGPKCSRPEFQAHPWRQVMTKTVEPTATSLVRHQHSSFRE